MFRKFIDSMQNIFASPDKRLELKTRELAMKTTQDFNNLQNIIKNGEYVMADYQKVVEDREQFLSVNTDKVDQNVTRNSDIQRADMLLLGVMLIGCILSVKGLRLFFGEFYASISLLMIIPIAMALAGLIVVGSIYVNNFSNKFRVQNPFVFYLIKVAAYTMVLLIPLMNLLEGFDSNYRPVIMILNIFACVVDFVIHSALVSMSSIFTSAEDSKKAIRIMRLKDKALATAEQKLRAFNDSFIKAKAVFTSSVKQFVSSFKELQVLNSTAASNTLYLLDNFTIWMSNTRVMQHALIPYHADDNGHPVVELTYFTPEQDSIRQGWDLLSTVRVNNLNNKQPERRYGQRQVTELPEGNEASPWTQGITPVENTRIRELRVEETVSQPANYETIMDSFNPNDKIL